MDASSDGSSCGYCGKIFQHRSSLSRHIKSIHDVRQSKASIHCDMDGCNFKCSTLNDLRDHLHADHDVAKETDTKNFASEKDFLIWKADEEKLTDSWFVKPCGTRKGKNGSTIKRFYCNRAGKFKPRGQGKRQMKSQGSSKINSHCPATMVVTQFSNGSISVVYNKTHQGHTNDLAHLRLSKAERTTVAGKLHAHVKMDAILDEIRDKVSTKFNRIHLTTRKDLHNISHAFGLNANEDIDDSASVKTWVEEMREKPRDENPVLLYKEQGVDQPADMNNVGKNDFVLGIMTGQMQSMLEKFGDQKIVCIDATHGTNEYKFQLITVMVVDEFREGIPVAWLISNREDQAVLFEFFMAIKQRTGDINVQFIMTDDAPQYCSAWTAVFGKGANKLLCTWHVDRSWRNMINQKITDKEVRANTYKSLRVIMEEQSKDRAKLYYESLTRDLCNNDATRTFGESFVKTYGSRIEEWALSYRIGSGINTNMYLESFFNVLKTTYLERRNNKRIDRLVATLLRVARDKVFERVTKLKKGKTSYRMTKINSRHQKSLKLKLDQVKTAGPNKWEVSGDADRVYDVRRHPSVKKPCCEVKCALCNICIHMITCTCMDAVIQTTLCKHVHFVHQHLITTQLVPVVENEGASSSTMPVPTTVSSVSNRPTSSIQDDNNHNLDELLQGVSQPEESMACLKTRLVSKLETLTAKIQQVQVVSILEDAEKAVSKVLRLVDLHPSSPMPPPSRRAPANKKAKPQRFKQTAQPKRTKTANRLVKPSHREQSAIITKLSAGQSVIATQRKDSANESSPSTSKNVQSKSTQNTVVPVHHKYGLRLRERSNTDLKSRIRYKVGGRVFGWGHKSKRLANLLHSVAKHAEVQQALLHNKLMAETSIKDNLDPVALDITDKDMKKLEEFFTYNGQAALQIAVADLRKQWACVLCDTVANMDMVECSKCRKWHHWSCAEISRKPKGDWHCQVCYEMPRNGAVNSRCQCKTNCRQQKCRCTCHRQSSSQIATSLSIQPSMGLQSSQSTSGMKSNPAISTAKPTMGILTRSASAEETVQLLQSARTTRSTLNKSASDKTISEQSHVSSIRKVLRSILKKGTNSITHQPSSSSRPSRKKRVTFVTPITGSNRSTLKRSASTEKTGEIQSIHLPKKRKSVSTELASTAGEHNYPSTSKSSKRTSTRTSAGTDQTITHQPSSSSRPSRKKRVTFVTPTTGSNRSTLKRSASTEKTGEIQSIHLPKKRKSVSTELASTAGEHNYPSTSKSSKRTSTRTSAGIDQTANELPTFDFLPSSMHGNMNLDSGGMSTRSTRDELTFTLDSMLESRRTEKENEKELKKKQEKDKEERALQSWQNVLSRNRCRDFTCDVDCRSSIGDLNDYIDDRRKVQMLADCIMQKCGHLMAAMKSSTSTNFSPQDCLIQYGNGYFKFIPESVKEAGLTPLRASGVDNSCMYNAISTLTGLKPDFIRLAAVACAIFYEEKLIAKLKETYIDRNSTVMWALQNSTKLYPAADWSVESIIVDVLKNEIKNTMTVGSDSGDVQMLMIATGIQKTLTMYSMDPHRPDLTMAPVVETRQQGSREPVKILLVPTKAHAPSNEIRFSHFVPLVGKHQVNASNNNLCEAQFFKMCMKPLNAKTLICQDCKKMYHQPCVESAEEPFRCGCVHVHPRTCQWFLESTEAHPVNIFLATEGGVLKDMWHKMEHEIKPCQRYAMLHANPTSKHNIDDRKEVEDRGLAFLPSNTAQYNQIISHIQLSIFGPDAPTSGHRVYSELLSSFPNKVKSIQMVKVLFPEVLAAHLKENEKLNRMEIEAIFGWKQQQQLLTDETADDDDDE